MEDRKFGKLDEDAISYIGELLDLGLLRKDIALKLGVGTYTIAKVVKRFFPEKQKKPQLSPLEETANAIKLTPLQRRVALVVTDGRVVNACRASRTEIQEALEALVPMNLEAVLWHLMDTASTRDLSEDPAWEWLGSQAKTEARSEEDAAVQKCAKVVPFKRNQ